MTKYIYIDESGDMGEKGSRHLIIVAIIVDEYRPLDRIIKNMRRHKFKKELRKATEIKANKSKPEIVIHMLKKLNEIDVQVICVVFEKKKLFNKYPRSDKNKLYNYVAGKLAEYILINADLEIRIDKSKGKQVFRKEFNEHFKQKLTRNKKLKQRIKIHHSYSHAWSGLQFADIVAWSCFQKFEHDYDGYINLLDKEKIKIYNIKNKTAEPKSTKTCTSRYTGFRVLPATCFISAMYIRMFRYIVRNINANI